MRGAGGMVLVESLRAWDGSVEHAEALRAEVAAAGPLRGMPLDGERGLAKLRAAKPGSGCAVAAWLVENPDERGVVAPLIGDPALAPWPWTDPLQVSDEHAAAGLALLGWRPLAIDASMRSFLRVFYREVRRPLWTAAARAIAMQATADPQLAQAITSWWDAAFPEKVVLRGGNTRARRHALLLGACASAMEVAPPRMDPKRLLALSPRDDADRSVVLAARVAAGAVDRVVELVEGGRYPLTLRGAVAARELLSPAAIEDLQRRVAEGSWSDADSLLALEEARQVLGLEPLVPDVTLDAIGLADRLGALFDPRRGPLLPREHRARELVVLLGAMGREPVASVAWADLARAAGEHVPSLSGRVHETGPAALVVLSALAGWPVQHLLRRAWLDRASVLQLAPLENGFVSTQLAIQLERLLRTSDDDAERVRLLWQLMVADPPSETFEKLALRIRCEVDPGERGEGPIVELVDALHELDRHRDRGAAIEDLAPAMRRVAVAVGAVLSNQEHPLDRMVSLLERDASADGVISALEAFAELLGGRPQGLVAWSCWVDDDESALTERSERLGRCLTGLQRAARVMLEARPRVEPGHLASIRGAARTLREELQRFGWPERHGLNALLDQLLDAAEADLETGHLATERSSSVDRCLQLGDEAGLVAELRSPDTIGLLAVRDLRRVHRFLLHQLRFRDADRLRRQVADRVALPSVASKLIPIFAAVVGGSFLVLDFGSDWIELAASWFEARVLVTTALTLVFSYLVLLVTLGSRMSDARGALRRWVVAARRIAPTWLAALVVATASAALVISTLGRPWSTLPIFSSLQLFLGVFVGLVLQGQPVLTTEDD